MIKKRNPIILSLVAVLILLFSSAAYAEVGDKLDDLGESTWSDKLSRGILNIVSSPVEIARTIRIQSKAKGNAYGWTAGLVEGIGRGIVRFGAGAIETLTFPFDFPNEDKSPLLEPEFPWQKWDADYL